MNLALIGLGMVAATHIRAISAASPTVKLRGVHARDVKKAEDFVEQMGSDIPEGTMIYASVDDIANDPLIDFAIVTTPPNARTAIVKKLVDAGKHILLEKPIERDRMAALEIVEMCEAANVALGIVFQHRAREVSLKLSELIKEEAFGAIKLVEISVPWWRNQAYYDEPGRGTYERDGGGVLISQAIHTMDLALTFTGPVRKVQAMAKTSAFHDMESEDFVSGGLEFASGAIGSLVASTASYPGGAESIILHCKKASVRLQSGKLDINWQDGRNEVFGEDTASGGGADPMAFTHAWHQGVIEDFAVAIKNNRPPMATGRQALMVHDLIDALVLSSREERAVLLSDLE
ncbi:MAG: Gfo/Idh/MocA family oxidoreductase [Hyphomicrobiales bacterium]